MMLAFKIIIPWNPLYLPKFTMQIYIFYLIQQKTLQSSMHKYWYLSTWFVLALMYVNVTSFLQSSKTAVHTSSGMACFALWQDSYIHFQSKHTCFMPKNNKVRQFGIRKRGSVIHHVPPCTENKRVSRRGMIYHVPPPSVKTNNRSHDTKWIRRNSRNVINHASTIYMNKFNKKTVLSIHTADICRCIVVR